MLKQPDVRRHLVCALGNSCQHVQHPAVHLQLHTVKIPLPQNIGKRFSRQQAFDTRFHGLTNLFRGIQIPISQNLLLTLAGNMGQ